MADDNDKLIIQIDLSTEQGQAKFKDAMSKIKNDANSAADDISKKFDFGAFAKIAALGVAAAGATVTAFFTKASIEAIEAERQFKRFEVALQMTGQYSSKFANDFSEMSTTIQRNTGYSADAIIESAGRIQTIAKLTQVELTKATKASVDLAAALGIDIETAAGLVSRAIEGNTGALSRYGIKVAEGKTETERFNNVLSALAPFMGTAEQKFSSVGAQLSLLKESFGDLLESIGNIIIKNPIFLATLQELNKWMIKTSDSVGVFASKTSEITKIGDSFKSVGESIAKFFIAPIEVAFNIVKFIGTNITAVIGETVIRPLAVAFDGIGTLLSKFSFSKSIGEGLKEAGDGLKLFSDTQKLAYEEIQFGNDVLKFNFADTFTQVTSSIGDSANKIKENLDATKVNFQQTTPAIQAETKKWEQAVASVAQIFQQTLVKGITLGIQFIVANLVKGEMSFKAFGKAMLNMLGDMAVQMGQVFVMFAIASSGMFSLLPGQALAAGLGLIALGSILKAYGGGDGMSSAGSSGGGGVSGGYSPSDSMVNQTPTQERVEQGNQVVVNIQGSVLDSDETGSRIIRLINENFQSSGNTITSGAVA